MASSPFPYPHSSAATYQQPFPFVPPTPPYAAPFPYAPPPPGFLQAPAYSPSAFPCPLVHPPPSPPPAFPHPRDLWSTFPTPVCYPTAPVAFTDPFSQAQAPPSAPPATLHSTYTPASVVSPPPPPAPTPTNGNAFLPNTVPTAPNCERQRPQPWVASEAAAALHQVQRELLNIQARLRSAMLKSRVSQCPVSTSKRSTSASRMQLDHAPVLLNDHPQMLKLRDSEIDAVQHQATVPSAVSHVAPQVFDEIPTPRTCPRTYGSTPGLVFDACADETEGCSTEFVDVLAGLPEQHTYEHKQHESAQLTKCSKANNTASFESMLVHSLQVPTTMQDAASVFKEKPVYDVYEDVTDCQSCLHPTIDITEVDTEEVDVKVDSGKPIISPERSSDGIFSFTNEKKFDTDLLVVCLNNASDNTISKEATNFTFPHAPIHADRSIKLTNEKSTQAASILSVHEAVVHCHEERSVINIKKQDMLINKHNITSSCDLNNDKEVPFVLHYQLPLSSTPGIWDPGIDLFSCKKMHLVSWIPQQESSQLPECFSQLTISSERPTVGTVGIFSLTNELTPEASQHLVQVLQQANIWSKFAACVNKVTDDAFRDDATAIHVPQFSVRDAPILAYVVMCCLASEWRWTELNASALLSLIGPCSTGKSCSLPSFENWAKLQWDPGIEISSHMYIWLHMRTVKTSTWLQSQLFSDWHYELLLRKAFKQFIGYSSIFSSTAMYMSGATNVCIRLVMSSGKLTQAEKDAAEMYQVFKTQLPMRKTTHIWDPGIDSLLFVYIGLHLHMFQLVYYSASCACHLVSALLPLTQVTAKGSSNIEIAVLTSRYMISHLHQTTNWISTTSNGITSFEYGYTMDCLSGQWEFLHQQGFQNNYNATNLLSSLDYLQLSGMDIIFTTFLPP